RSSDNAPAAWTAVAHSTAFHCASERGCDPPHLESDRSVGFIKTQGDRHRPCGSQDQLDSARKKPAALCLSLLARNERGESRREGKLIKRSSSPRPSPLFEEERERKRGYALKANLLPNTTGHKPALLWLRLRRAGLYRRVAPRLRIPTGFRPSAQVCEARATLGHRPTNIPNRNAVEAHSFSPARLTSATTPLALIRFPDAHPRRSEEHTS